MFLESGPVSSSPVVNPNEREVTPLPPNLSAIYVEPLGAVALSTTVTTDVAATIAVAVSPAPFGGKLSSVTHEVSLELRWMPPQDRLPMQLLMILMEVRIFPLQQGEKDGLGQSVKVVCSQTHSSSRFSGFLPGFVKYFGSRTTSPIVKRGGLGVFVLCYGFSS